MNRNAIALIDPLTGGHHEWYLQVFAEALARLGRGVMVVGPRASDVVARVSHDGRSPLVAVDWEPGAILRGRALGRRRLWDSTHAVLNEAERFTGLSIEFCFLAWMESWLGRWQSRACIERAFPRRFAGLVFQPWMYRVRGRFPAVRRGLLDPHRPLHARTCRGIAVLDHAVAAEMSQRTRRAVVSFPDVPNIESDDQCDIARLLEARAAGRSIVLLTGVIDERKGLRRFLAQAEQARGQPWYFAVAGPAARHALSADEQQAWDGLLESPRDNVSVLAARFLSEPEINALVRRSALVWLCYERFPFSSNLLGKAAAFGVPVVANGPFLIAEHVRAYGLGWVVETDAEMCRMFTQEGAERVAALARGEAFRRGSATFALANTPAALDKAFAELLSVVEKG